MLNTAYCALLGHADDRPTWPRWCRTWAGDLVPCAPLPDEDNTATAQACRHIADRRLADARELVA